MNARERAEESVYLAIISIDNPRVEGCERGWAKRTAQFASDVWEPIVRELVDAHEFPMALPFQQCRERLDAALARAREALGETTKEEQR